MSSSSPIQVIEVPTSAPISCPFCGFQMYPGDQVEDWTFEPSAGVCEHALFFVTDGGFEYRSSRFNEHMGLFDNQVSEPELPLDEGTGFEGYDAFTSKVTIPGSVKIASYMEPPALFGAYYGFAPN